MKTLVKRILIFTAIVFLVYPLAVVLWSHFAPLTLRPPYTSGGSGLRFAEAKTVNSIDVLFLGSSHAARGFDPRIFEASGLKAFNLGSDSQTPKNTLHLLDQYIDRLNPRLVVYEICPTSFVSSGIEAAIHIMANNRTDPELALKQVLRYRSIKLMNALIYNASKVIIRTDAVMSNNSQLEGVRYIDGGFVENRLCSFDERPLGVTDWTQRNDQVAAFKEITRLLHGKGINVVFVSAPELQARYGNRTPDGAFRKFISDYQPYYDFNPILNLKSTDYFCDPSHLNQRGVEVFNRKLIELLTDIN